jgi:hypothetical protein
MKLDQFPDTARIWIYTSDRAVSDKEQQEMAAPIHAFLDQWAAHGNPLTAAGAWLNAYQLVVALDESMAGASGCSIDSQTRFMRELGAKHNIDWFNRLSMVVEHAEEVKLVSFFELSEHADALLYDALVQRLGDIRTNWPVPLMESRYKHLLT